MGLREALAKVCLPVADSDIAFVHSFFTVLSSALPYVLSQEVDSKATLFDDDDSDGDDEEVATDLGPAGGDAKRCRLGTDQHAIVELENCRFEQRWIESLDLTQFSSFRTAAFRCNFERPEIFWKSGARNNDWNGRFQK